MKSKFTYVKLTLLALALSCGSTYAHSKTAMNSKAGSASAKALITQMMTVMRQVFVLTNTMATDFGSAQQYSQKQIDCFTNQSNDKLTQDLHALLAQEFSKDELVKMDAYFLSDTGKKAASLSMIDVLEDDKEKAPKRLTPKQQKEAETFWSSDVGEKLAGLLEDESSMDAAYSRAIEEKEKLCKMPKGGLM